MYDLNKIGVVALNLDSFSRDCAITVALKISDDSCKMDLYEKQIFMMLYDAMAETNSAFFDSSVHEIIKQARRQPSAPIYAQIKRLREAAMEMITRPNMKAFKADIRARLGIE